MNLPNDSDLLVVSTRVYSDLFPPDYYANKYIIHKKMWDLIQDYPYLYPQLSVLALTGISRHH